MSVPYSLMPDLEPSIASRLLRSLPDTPGWVDIRGMLLSGPATVTGGASVEEGFVVRALSGALAVVGVVGFPDPAIIAQAVDGVTDMTPVIAQRDNAGHVGLALASRPMSGSQAPWTAERAIMHRLVSPGATPPPTGASIRILRADDRLDHVPAGLRFELTHARTMVPVAGALVDGRPVAFCYPCWLTETLWDVSIDTLDPYRRRGLADAAVRFMIAAMKQEGRDPVWGALESNAASLALARRLGFTPDDEIVVFSRGPWAYLTRGFEDGQRRYTEQTGGK